MSNVIENPVGLEGVAGLAELQAMIEGTCAAWPEPKQRQKALKAVQWRMRGPNGEFVGLDAGRGYRCAFVAEGKAMVFDGRDNEVMKLRFYRACMGGVELSVEIIPQILCAS